MAASSIRISWVAGNRVALELISGRYQKIYSLSHTDPYRTIDGVRRTMGVNYREITQFTSASSDFSTTSAGATLDYGYPISEYQTLSYGLNYQHAELLASTSSTQQAQDWVLNNGDPFLRDHRQWRSVLRHRVRCGRIDCWLDISTAGTGRCLRIEERVSKSCWV